MSSSSPRDVDASDAVRRASGRARKQPDNYTSSPFSSGKRKRSGNTDNDGDVQMPDDYVSDEDIPSADEEPDEEEIREQKRARKSKQTKPKATQKKPKTHALPIRNATAGAKKKKAPRKVKGVDTLVEEERAAGLYAQIFVREASLEETIADWLQLFRDDEAQALADVVNFVLQGAGCDIQVSHYDIGDPDGCTNRLTDIQEEFQASGPTDYPLIIKGKQGTIFRQVFTEFLDMLIKSIAATGALYTQEDVLDNIQIWLSTMSSAGNRAFRHTATVASLSVMTALCELAAQKSQTAAATQLQAEKERSNARVNQARVKQLDQTVKLATQAQEYLRAQLKDWFDTVFIHRYRDVDPAIRRDCVIALGDWIMAYPDAFFDGSHLRYFGWVLSDTVASTRTEVVKQLTRLYKEESKIVGLQAFTERFRSRLVEVATSDAESSVRAAGIELLDLLRENGLLEPDDVDAVGRLVYDSDMRVRKAVASFFAENVNDLFSSKVDDLGGLESLEDALPEVTDGNLDAPRLEWLKYKSLAEMMVAYDTKDGLPSQLERNRDGTFILHAAAMDSRYTLAADVLYSKIDDVKDWQGLAGYLLFDHSAGRANGVAEDTFSQLKHQCTLTEEEETILLEVVSGSVKRTILDLAEKTTSAKSKLTKKQKAELKEEQEEAARYLATLVPKLLNKFGDVPSTAAAVLRMQGVLSLPSLQELQQDTETYGSLLDDIRKQFMAHGTDEVLAPATEAISHAKSYGELDDLTEERLAGLWQDVITNLAELLNPDTITVRGASNSEELVALSNNLLRIIRLSQVSDCITALEDTSVATTNEATGAVYKGAIDYVIALIQRAVPDGGSLIDQEDARLEDEIALRAAEASLKYLYWKLTQIMQNVQSGTGGEIAFEELEALAARRDQYANDLHAVLQSRKAADLMCTKLAEYLLDLHYTAAVLSNIDVRPGTNHDWDVLIMEVSPSHAKPIMKIFTAAEKNFAQLSGKKLEEVPITNGNGDADLDAEPIDDDPLSDSESEDDDDQPTQTQGSQQRKEKRQQDIVLAEQRLCELTRSLIYAIHAGVMDSVSTRQRLELNKAKLGPNYKELLNYLDFGKTKKGAKSKAKTKKPTANGVAAKLKPHPKSNAIIAEDDMDEEIEDADGADEDVLEHHEPNGDSEQVAEVEERAGAANEEGGSVFGD